MKTDFQKINSFDVAIVSMIAVGFVILGITVFSSLSPRQQSHVSSAMEMFDIRKPVAETTEIVKFVWGIPEEFNRQFYIAFIEIASIPAESLEIPIDIASEFKRNVVVVFDHLTDDVMRGYAAQKNYQFVYSDYHEPAYNSKVMGAAIEIADELSTVAVVEQRVPSSLNLKYDYAPPTFPKLDIALSYIKP